MTPSNFPEANQIFHKPETMTDEQCAPLAVHNDRTQIVSCWEMSAEEKLKALFFGRIWISVIGQSLPPIWMEINKTVFIADGNEPDARFLENYKKRKIRQFCESRFSELELDSAVQMTYIEETLLGFLEFLFQEQK